MTGSVTVGPRVGQDLFPGLPDPQDFHLGPPQESIVPIFDGSEIVLMSITRMLVITM